MYSKCLAYFLLIILFTCTSYSQNFEGVNQKSRSIMEKFRQKENIPGLSVTITYNDTIIYSEGLGYADIENKVPVVPSETTFRIASITKTITAATIALMEEKRKIDTQKSVYYYLDSLPRKQYDFTLEQIGGHIAGLQRHASEDTYACISPYQRKDFYRVFKKDSLVYIPGEKFVYSNYGYKILGLVLEKIEKQPITQIQKKYILDKLGMIKTRPDDKVYTRSTSRFYSEKDNKIVEADCLDCSFMYAEGCHLSTTEDLALLGNAFLFTGRLLSKESLLKLVKSKTLSNGTKTGYGFGFVSNKSNEGDYYYGHNGTLPGARAAMRIYPKSKLVITILCNRYIEDIDTVTDKIARNYVSAIEASVQKK